MKDKIALIGSGNPFFKDEGIGLYAVKYLKENYDFVPGVTIFDGGILGFKLMTLLQEFEQVIILNTSSDDAVYAGEITIKNAQEFIESSPIKKTANEVEIAQMLQICSLTDKMADTTIVSITPEDILSVEVGLSACIKEALPFFVDAVLDRLNDLGVKSQLNRNDFCIDKILHTFSNPSIEHSRGF